MLLGFLFRIVFRLFLIIFVWREHWRCWVGGGAEILRVCLGALKNRWVQGEGVKSGCRTKDWLHEDDSLCRDPGTLVNRIKNQLCDYMTTEPARLAGIPVLWCRDPGGNFPSNHACPANEPSEKQDSCMVTHTVHAHCSPSSCDQALTVSCIVTQFSRESFGICRFRGSCMREYDLI